MQPKWSATQGNSERRGEKNVGISLASSEPLNLCRLCVFGAHKCWQGAASDWLLSSMSIIVLLLTLFLLCSLGRVCSSWACLRSVWSLQSPVVFCSWLIKLVSVTGQPYLKHMAMSVPFTRQHFNVYQVPRLKDSNSKSLRDITKEIKKFGWTFEYFMTRNICFIQYC